MGGKNNPMAGLPGPGVPPPLPPPERVVPGSPMPSQSLSLAPATQISSVTPSRRGITRRKCEASTAPKYASDSLPRGNQKLLFYIHGFMGNKKSFQSSPAHLYNLLSIALGHLGSGAHTKVYPKFKTRYNISLATEAFSKWHAQFENPSTDAILLGHSVRGILEAAVVLLRDERGD